MERFRMPALLGASLLLGSCNPAPIPDSAGDQDTAVFDLAPRVDEFLAETVEHLEIPGLTVAIVRDDEIVADPRRRLVGQQLERDPATCWSASSAKRAPLRP